MHIYAAICVMMLVILLNYNSGQTLHEKNNIRKHLGTQTPYRFIYNKNDSILTFPGKLLLLSFVNFDFLKSSSA